MRPAVGVVHGKWRKQLRLLPKIGIALDKTSGRFLGITLRVFRLAADAPFLHGSFVPLLAREPNFYPQDAGEEFLAFCTNVSKSNFGDLYCGAARSLSAVGRATTPGGKAFYAR
jgi:hypothetical protein